MPQENPSADEGKRKPPSSPSGACPLLRATHLLGLARLTLSASAGLQRNRSRLSRSIRKQVRIAGRARRCTPALLQVAQPTFFFSGGGGSGRFRFPLCLRFAQAPARGATAGTDTIALDLASAHVCPAVLGLLRWSIGL